MVVQCGLHTNFRPSQDRTTNEFQSTKCPTFSIVRQDIISATVKCNRLRKSTTVSEITIVIRVVQREREVTKNLFDKSLFRSLCWNLWTISLPSKLLEPTPNYTPTDWKLTKPTEETTVTLSYSRRPVLDPSKKIHRKRSFEKIRLELSFWCLIIKS